MELSDETKNILATAEKYFLEGKYEKAINYFNQILKLHFDDEDIWYIHLKLGNCYVLIQEFLKAKESLVKAFNNENAKSQGVEFLQIIDFLAFTSFKLGEYENALKYYNLADDHFKLYSGSQWNTHRFCFWRDKGRLFYYLQEYKKALKEFNKAYKEIGNIVDEPEWTKEINYLYIDMASTCAYLKKMRQMKKYLSHADLTNIKNDFYIGNFYYLKGHADYSKMNFEQCISNMQKSLEFGGFEEGAFAEIYFYIGSSYNKLREYENGRKYFKMSMKYPTDNTPIQEILKKYFQSPEEP